MDWLLQAQELHKNSIVIDAHLDLGGIVYNNRKKGKHKVMEGLFLEDFREGGFKFIVAAIFVESEFLPEMGLRMALRQIVCLKEDIDESSDIFMLIKTKKDMDAAIEQNKIGIIMSLEGADPIHNDLGLLNVFYELGVRGLGLAWSRRNPVSDGSYFRNPEEGIRGGLTPFGIQLVRKAEELGFFIDVSHINDEGFSDVLKYTKKAFIASHSDSRAINALPRNLTDEQIISIGSRGGIIGINTYTGIVSSDPDGQTVSTLCDHIEHIIKLAGEDILCFGFDLCTIYYNSSKQLDIIKDHSESILITAELLKRGYSPLTIEKIIGKNMFRYLYEHM